MKSDYIKIKRNQFQIWREEAAKEWEGNKVTQDAISKLGITATQKTYLKYSYVFRYVEEKLENFGK